MIGLPPGSLITRLRELDHTGYVRTEKTGHRVPGPSERPASHLFGTLITRDARAHA